MASLSEALKLVSAVVLTGGSSGIGKSFIELVSRMEPRLLICNLSRRSPDINSPQLNLRHFPCDLGQTAGLERAATGVLSLLKAEAPRGRVLLINNSGFGSLGCFLESDFAQQLEIVDVNVRAAIDLTARLLPALSHQGGHILNIASTAAFQPTPHMATYGASKAFLLYWSLALREELRRSGVGVTAVCPGPTATGFGVRAGLAAGTVSGRFGHTAQQVALMALKGFAGNRPVVICGARNRFLAWFASHTPKAFSARIAGKVIDRAIRPGRG